MVVIIIQADVLLIALVVYDSVIVVFVFSIVVIKQLQCV